MSLTRSDRLSETHLVPTESETLTALPNSALLSLSTPVDYFEGVSYIGSVEAPDRVTAVVRAFIEDEDAVERAVTHAPSSSS